MIFPERLLRRLTLSVIILLVLTAAVAFLAPRIIKLSLNHWLPIWLGSEADPAALHISQLGWHGAKLDYLTLRLDDGSVLNLKELQLGYRPSALWQGRLSWLTLKEVQLEVTNGVVEEVAQEAGQDAKELAHSHFNNHIHIPEFKQWLQLPIGQLSIDAIKVIHPQAQASLQAKVKDGFWRLHGSMQLQQLAEPWRLELQLQDTGRWFLLVSEDSETLLQQFGRVQQTAEFTHIEMQQSIYFERFLELVEDMPPLDKLQLQGSFTLPNQGVLPAEAQGELHIQLSTSTGQLFTTNDWQATQWQLDVNKKAADQPWLFKLISQPTSLRLPSEWTAALTTESLYVVAQQQLSGECVAELSSCSMQGELSNQLHNIQREALVDAQLNPVLSWDIHQGIQSDWSIQADTFPAFQQAFALPLKRLQLKGRLDANLTTAGDWLLSSKDGLHGVLDMAAIEAWSIPTLNLELLPDLKLYGNLKATNVRQKLRSDPLTIQLAPVVITQTEDQIKLVLAESRMSCRPIISAASTAATCQLMLNLDKSSVAQWPIPDMQLSGNLMWHQRLEQSAVNAQLMMQAANQQFKVRLNTQHDLTAKQGNLQWHLSDTALNWSRLNLVEMRELTEFELLDGSLSGQGWVDWYLEDEQWKVLPDTSLRIDNLAATYSDVLTMEGWNALLSLRRPLMGDYLLDAQFSGESLNPGVPLKNILARSQTRIDPSFDFAIADIYEVRTDLLGGTVRTPLIHFDTRQENNALTVELDHIQLSQITALEPSSEVRATGTLDGIVPIILTPEGPLVPTGNLFARDPGGTVQYQNSTAAALANSNDSMGLAMQLLQNFRYDHLQTTVHYQPDGQFNFGLQFQGYNPDFFSGKPTHLNVNLDYNLLDLLESLRIADDLIERVEQRYQ